jgi:hypothetical protein
MIEPTAHILMQISFRKYQEIYTFLPFFYFFLELLKCPSLIWTSELHPRFRKLHCRVGGIMSFTYTVIRQFVKSFWTISFKLKICIKSIKYNWLPRINENVYILFCNFVGVMMNINDDAKMRWVYSTLVHSVREQEICHVLRMTR